MRNTSVFSLASGAGLALVAILGLGLAACGGDGDGDGDGNGADAGDPGDVMLRGACPLDSRLGGFTVEVHPEFSLIDGDVSNGVVPVTILEETFADGDCKLLRRNNPFCDPPCQAGTTCDFDGSCIAFPEKQDLGTITVSGLVQDVVLEPVEPSNDYFAVGLPHPVFEPGAVVTLTSTDGFYGELSLAGVGGGALTPADEQWNIAEGEALAVTWDAPAADARTRALLRLSIDQHGTTPVTLVCDFADTGVGEIPQTVIDELVAAGISGFPNGTLTRRTVDRQEVSDGCMEFQVALPVQQDVRVSGHIPCNVPMDCPLGQTCDLPTQTCI